MLVTALFPVQGTGDLEFLFAFLTARIQWVKEIPVFPQITTGVSEKSLYIFISVFSHKCLKLQQKKTDALKKKKK